MIESLLIAIIAGIIWSQIISHWGASILLHRHYCHKQFNVPVWFETVGLAMLMIACIRTPIGWIASHRMHHKHSDSPGDPHAAKHVGYWKVLFTTWSIQRIPPRFARDLFDNPRLVFCHKHWLKIIIIVNVTSVLINPYFWVAFCVVPFIFAKIGFGLLNTVGHKDEGGADVPWLNFFIAGEGYHKQHHTDFRKVRLHKWDTAGWLAEKLFVTRR
jgi:stearoyl-CoA desaturase (delta-9 desaturase)|tara:strand:+ start:226 stop:870 length:645 start_codon:yes stop_codon:yes gene_type:complete